jgi:hypothetical protein
MAEDAPDDNDFGFGDIEQITNSLRVHIENSFKCAVKVQTHLFHFLQQLPRTRFSLEQKEEWLRQIFAAVQYLVGELITSRAWYEVLHPEPEAHDLDLPVIHGLDPDVD